MCPIYFDRYTIYRLIMNIVDSYLQGQDGPNDQFIVDTNYAKLKNNMKRVLQIVVEQEQDGLWPSRN